MPRMTGTKNKIHLIKTYHLSLAWCGQETSHVTEDKSIVDCQKCLSVSTGRTTRRGRA
jgi:hypothetical protein